MVMRPEYELSLTVLTPVGPICGRQAERDHRYTGESTIKYSKKCTLDKDASDWQSTGKWCCAQ